MPTIVMKAKALPVAMLSHRLNVRDSWKQADVEMQEILSPKGRLFEKFASKWNLSKGRTDKLNGENPFLAGECKKPLLT